jgi:hypothetical protein
MLLKIDNMKITATKIKRELIAKCGYSEIKLSAKKELVDNVIKDTLSIINDILKREKNITIK